MNLDMVRPTNQTEDLSFSITKNCEIFFFEQFQTKPQEALEPKLTNPEKLSHLNHLLILVLTPNGW